ncbi:hypothetical protein J6590_090529 [Homalodisca vitripennis]|nr:hypothetical protein J6590_090529 [Homalodisca vitripennis]
MVQECTSVNEPKPVLVEGREWLLWRTTSYVLQGCQYNKVKFPRESHRPVFRGPQVLREDWSIASGKWRERLMMIPFEFVQTLKHQLSQNLLALQT